MESPSNNPAHLYGGPEIPPEIAAEMYKRDLMELRFEKDNTPKGTLRFFDLETLDAIIPEKLWQSIGFQMGW